MNADPWQMNYTGVIRLLVGCLTPEDGLTPVCLWAIVTGLGLFNNKERGHEVKREEGGGTKESWREVMVNLIKINCINV